MSRIYINCEKCGNNFSVSDGYEGMNVKCRDCGNLIYIPDSKAIAFWLKLIINIAIIITACCVGGSEAGIVIGILLLLSW